ncbi:membrane cofactor protein-like isoform 2-T2 [Anableps anableps]
MSVSALFLLSSISFVITAQAQQCSIPAGRQNMHLKDAYILKDTFEDGSTVAFTCNIGYTSAGGSGSIKCSAGIWTPVQLTCERKNCGALEEVTNGDISYPQGTQFGDKALITCNTGHRLVGKSEIRCGDQGWMDRMPVCEVVRCLQPGGTANGVQCKDPVIPNAEYIDGSRPPHRYKATVIYNCKPGYKMIGQATLTCNINSQWWPKIPVCTSNGNSVVVGLVGGLVSITVLLVQNYWM